MYHVALGELPPGGNLRNEMNGLHIVETFLMQILKLYVVLQGVLEWLVSED